MIMSDLYWLTSEKKNSINWDKKKYLGVIFRRYHSRFFPSIGSHIPKFFWNYVQYVVIAQIRMKLIYGAHGPPWFPWILVWIVVQPFNIKFYCRRFLFIANVGNDLFNKKFRVVATSCVSRWLGSWVEPKRFQLTCMNITIFLRGKILYSVFTFIIAYNKKWAQPHTV